MNKMRNLISVLVGLVVLAALVVGLAWLLGPQGVRPGQQASPLPTPTPIGYEPTAPSEDWPTLMPPPTWPPLPTPRGTPVVKGTVQVTPIQPFPTPDFLPTPSGERPADLQMIWFPYFPAPDNQPLFQAVLVDTKGQRWAQSDRLLELAVPRRQPGPDPGPVLVDLQASLNSLWLIADSRYVGSRLVDLSSGKIQPVVTGAYDEQWHFWDWHPDGQRALVSAREEFLLIDLASREYEVLDYFSQSEHAQISEVAYSPSSRQLADAVIYPPIYEVKESWSAEVGLREDETGERRSVVQIAGGTYFANHSLVWSPDGQRLIWIVQTVPSDVGVQVGLADTQVQLWIADLSRDDAKVLAVLGEAVEYYHSAAWSPDGRTVAALTVEEALEGKIIASNIFLFDVESGTRQQITHFINQQLSHLTWSPDGQWLAFTVSCGEYGEIWMTSLDGTLQYPVAGPTVLDAPFVWLPATEGGK